MTAYRFPVGTRVVLRSHEYGHLFGQLGTVKGYTDTSWAWVVFDVTRLSVGVDVADLAYAPEGL